MKSLLIFNSLIFFSFAQEAPLNLTFYSMGTYWNIDISQPAVSFPKEYLFEKIIQQIDNYDKTFSDWREDSELNFLEKNLTDYQRPSDLFLRGLKYSQWAYKASLENFDITVGAVLWKESEKKVGLDKLIIHNDKFKFNQNPKRLTFGGIAKGMAVGQLARWFFLRGIKNFRINAGDGNLALSGKNLSVGWEEEMQIGKIDWEEVVFISRSSLMQKGRTHIIGQSNEITNTLIICNSPFKEHLRWEELGAISDAFSTALILNNSLDWSRYGCKKII